MATFGHSMLTAEVEESVNAEAGVLERCDLSTLLREQDEAVQHILAVSTVLARRVHALDAQAKGQYPADLASVPPPPPPLRNPMANGLPELPEKGSSDTTTPRGPLGLGRGGSSDTNPTPRGLAEPLLASPRAGCSLVPTSSPEGRPFAPTRSGDSRRNSISSGGLFPDEAVVQTFIKSCLHKDSYRVEDLYKETGCFQDIAQDANFRNLTFVAIFLNTLWIGYDTDHNHAEVLCDADLRFQLVENFFCAFFCFEIAVRFLAFKNKKDALTDPWFGFDFVLVFLMVWETWVSVALYLIMHDFHGSGAATGILRIFRLFRLTRVARLGRLISFVPELMLLVKGMLMALRSVGSTLLLMFVIVYIFSVLFTQLLKESSVGQGRFETVPMSINFLMVRSVFPDQKGDLEDMLDESFMYYLCMIIFLLLGSVTVMNMLIGVLCEVVSIVAEAERREGKEIALKTQLMEIIETADANQDMSMDVDEMTNMMGTNAEAVKLLDDAGVDVESMMQNLDVVFQGNVSLPYDEILNAILRFRSETPATQKDLVDVQKTIDDRLDTLLLHIKRIGCE